MLISFASWRKTDLHISSSNEEDDSVATQDEMRSNMNMPERFIWESIYWNCTRKSTTCEWSTDSIPYIFTVLSAVYSTIPPTHFSNRSCLHFFNKKRNGVTHNADESFTFMFFQWIMYLCIVIKIKFLYHKNTVNYSSSFIGFNPSITIWPPDIPAFAFSVAIWSRRGWAERRGFVMIPFTRTRKQKVTSNSFLDFEDRSL